MTGRRDDSDEVFARRIAERLDRDAGETPSDDRRALRLARAAAVEAAVSGPRFITRPRFALAGGMLGVALAVGVALQLDSPAPGDLAEPAPEWFVAGDDIELYEEVEFFLWLDQMDEVG